MIEPRMAADSVRQRALALGFDLVGFGSAESFETARELILEDLARGRLGGMAWITPERVRLSCDPETLLPGARTIVGLGMAYGPGGSTAGCPIDDLPRGRVARYARGRDYHDVIRPRLRSLAGTIVDAFGADTRCRTFVDTGPLVDRAAAVRAGLGFIGKNTCLLTGRHGSYVLLSAILTTAELRPDPPVTKDCGLCRACIDACPTEAIVAPGQLNATRCISYLTIEHRGAIPTQLRPKMGDWVFGCDICQEVCPWNQARPDPKHSEFQPTDQAGNLTSTSRQSTDDGRISASSSGFQTMGDGNDLDKIGAGESLDLIEVLGLDDAGFRARFRGTPLTRPKRRGLLRNAAVALGNQRDARAAPALLCALSDEEPLVRGHAAWALGQLPSDATVRDGLRRALGSETDEYVRQEIVEALGG
jgi:epoxyqueuosine reductase